MASSNRKDMTKIAALVISEDHYNALGVARSLGKVHIPVFLLIESGSNSYVGKSKYVNETYYLNSCYDLINDYVSCLALKYTKLFLFPLSDKSARVVDEKFWGFPNNVISPNMKGRMQEYQNKALLKEYALSVGMKVPQGIDVDLNRNPNMISWSTYPAIIKPLVSIEGKKTDIRTVNNQNQLINALLYYKEQGYNRALIEEYVCGSDAHMIEVMGYCSQGKAVINGIISKIREFPISNGSTSYASIVDHHEGIIESIVVKFVEGLEFSGIFDMEFKYANGDCFFIECNFRNGAPGYALTLSGRNIPVMWINSFEKEKLNTVENKKNKNNFKFMCEQNDVLNLLKHEVPFFKWIWQFISCKKVFMKISDAAPCIKYFFDFIHYHFTKKEKLI